MPEIGTGDAESIRIRRDFPPLRRGKQGRWQGHVMDDLVVRARTDREAFGRLYDSYYPHIFRYCLRRLFIRAVAEDVTSDVFLRVATHMREFSGTTQENFRRWLYRIATNEINAHIRRTKRRKDLLESAARAQRLQATDCSTSHRADLDSLDWPILYQAILRLKPREQSIIALRFFEQMSHDEIAEVLKERSTTVRVALSRALEKLRRRLKTPQGRTTADSQEAGFQETTEQREQSSHELR